MEAAQTPETEPRSLVRLSDVAPFTGLAQALQNLLEAKPRAPVPTLSLADKLTLSLMEAAQLAGLSRNHLREAITEGKLKARIIGRGWRVKRSDLDAYVRRL